MKKLISLVLLLGVLGAAIYIGSAIEDKKTLTDTVLRLHVVADSDDEQDQNVKLKVRDAVLQTLEKIAGDASTKAEVSRSVQERLEELSETANRVLQEENLPYTAQVSIKKEAFPARQYDTFSLPAGVYDSLRITIGSGEGKNWWCVVFPSLCVGAASQEVADTAVSAGFSEELSDTITGEEGYEIRFFVMDCLGWLENFFYSL